MSLLKKTKSIPSKTVAVNEADRWKERQRSYPGRSAGYVDTANDKYRITNNPHSNMRLNRQKSADAIVAGSLPAKG